MRFLALFSVAAFAIRAGANRVDFRQFDVRDDTPSPCAVVRSRLAANATRVGQIPTIGAQLAYDCLNSVPLHAREALDLVEAILPYIEWQSDLAYLKDPPPGYLFPAIDVFGSLATIKDKLTKLSYESEYHFHVDLYQVFLNAHHGHFAYYSDLLSKVFIWGRQFSLVSVSLESLGLPKIYITSDVHSWWATGRQEFPSEVKRINGVDARQYVEEFSRLAAPFQDPDAAYNSMFFDRATAASSGEGYFIGGGPYSFIYPGPSTIFEFGNGTLITSQNVASFQHGVQDDFKNVTDGESLYQQFCALSSTSTSSTSSPSATATHRAVKTTVPGYPDPIDIDLDNSVSGYFLDVSDYNDIAVLSVLDFMPSSPAKFQEVVQNFLSEARQRGKTKIVVDLSSNGGGYILLGYDLYRQFFPDVVQDGFSRFRENNAFLACAEIFSNMIPPHYNPNTSPLLLIDYYENPANYRFDLDIDDQSFASFEAKFKPHTFKEDKFTSIVRANLSDPLLTTNAKFGLGIEITGYGTRRNFNQHFAAENIIMLYNGQCSSTCAVFSEFMRLGSGVKSIVMGGRPSISKMQAVGGAKGAQVLSWKNIHDIAQLALPFATMKQRRVLMNITDLPLQRSTMAGAINVRDQILRPNLQDGVPAQFVYEAADCRLFWTPEMMLDVREVWKVAANAAFREKTCWGEKRPDMGTKTGEEKERDVWRAPRRKRVRRGLQAERIAG